MSPRPTSRETRIRPAPVAAETTSGSGTGRSPTGPGSGRGEAVVGVEAYWGGTGGGGDPSGEVERVHVAVARADIDHPVGHRRRGKDGVSGAICPKSGPGGRAERVHVVVV